MWLLITRAVRFGFDSLVESVVVAGNAVFDLLIEFWAILRWIQLQVVFLSGP